MQVSLKVTIFVKFLVSKYFELVYQIAANLSHLLARTVFKAKFEKIPKSMYTAHVVYRTPVFLNGMLFAY